MTTGLRGTVAEETIWQENIRFYEAYKKKALSMFLTDWQE